MNTAADNNFTLSIAKEVMGSLPAASYHGEEIVLIDSPELVDSAVEDLYKSPIIGFDTETRPSFKKGVKYSVSLLQLSTKLKTYLFRLNIIGFPDSLKSLLEDRHKLKIGLSINDDFRNLARLAEFNPGGFIDLQQYVKTYLIADNSLTRIHSIIFGQRISKNQRLTNWEAENLTVAQQTYAALDALACIDIYEYLSSGRFSPYASEYKVFPQPVSATPLEEKTVEPKEEEPRPKVKNTRKKRVKKTQSTKKAEVSDKKSAAKSTKPKEGKTAKKRAGIKVNLEKQKAKEK